MVKIKAKIKLYADVGKRKIPFKNGYRPLFDVLDDTRVSGMIILLDRDEFKPGEKGIVEIKFIEAKISNDTSFYFYESEEPLGEGIVLEILDL